MPELNISKKAVFTTIAITGFLIGTVGAYWYMNYARTVPSIRNRAITSSGSTDAKTAPDTAVGYASAVSEDTVVLRANKSSSLAKDELVESGDIVTAGPLGGVEIVFVDHSIVRLNPNSIFKIVGSNQINLDTWSVWSRILKPIQDSSVFTIRTDDLMASVRGTAVETAKTSTGSKVVVIDSTSDSGAVDVTMDTGSGKKSASLSAEEYLTAGKDDFKKWKVKMDQALKDEAVNENLKKDLLYLHVLLTESSARVRVPINMRTLDYGQKEKVRREFDLSLPKPEELDSFFESHAIAEEAGQLRLFQKNRTVTGSGWLTAEEEESEAMYYVQEDLGLLDLKNKLEQFRSQSIIWQDEAQKDAFQKKVNDLENQIRNFDEDFSARNQARIQSMRQSKAAAEKERLDQIEKFEGDTPEITSGPVVPESLQSVSGSAFPR